MENKNVMDDVLRCDYRKLMGKHVHVRAKVVGVTYNHKNEVVFTVQIGENFMRPDVAPGNIVYCEDVAKIVSDEDIENTFIDLVRFGTPYNEASVKTAEKLRVDVKRVEQLIDRFMNS